MNLSNVYGGYGGVTRKTRYVPPKTADIQPLFTPNQPQMPIVAEYKHIIETLTDENSPINNVENVLIRSEIPSLSATPGIKDYVLYTPGNNEYGLTYSAPITSTKQDMLVSDGGYF